jgi:hypothetical protein
MMTSGFSKLTQRQQEQLLIHLFQKWLVKLNLGLDAKFVPQNLLPRLCIDEAICLYFMLVKQTI